MSGITSDTFTVTTAGEFVLSAFYANRSWVTGGMQRCFSLSLLDSSDNVVTPVTSIRSGH